MTDQTGFVSKRVDASVCHPDVPRRILHRRPMQPDPSEYLRMTRGAPVRFVAWATAVAVCLSLVAAPRSAQSAQLGVRIVAESLPGPTSGDIGSVAARSVLREFLRRNP